MPQVPGTTPSMAQPTNTAQNTWNAFGAQQNAYNQGVATDNANTQGMFGLAGSALGAYGSYMGLAALA